MHQNNIAFLWAGQIIVWILCLPFYLLMWTLLKSLQVIMFFGLLVGRRNFAVAAKESELFKISEPGGFFSEFLQKELNVRKERKLDVGTALAQDISIILGLGTVLTSGDGIHLCLAMRHRERRYELGWFENQKWKEAPLIISFADDKPFVEWLSRQNGKSFQKLERAQNSYTARKLAIDCAQCAPNESVSYGRHLAQLVAVHLTNGNNIYYGHRDYCGMGLAYHNDQFIYDMVIDGLFRFHDPDIERPLVDDGKISSSREEFVDWLARQNDASLSGRAGGDSWITNNQRITRQRFVARLPHRFESLLLVRPTYLK